MIFARFVFGRMILLSFNILAQINYVQFSACRFDMVKNVRPSAVEEQRDDRWFPLWAKSIKWKNENGAAEFGQENLKPMVSHDFEPYWLANK
jgi:hypothetical protein